MANNATCDKLKNVAGDYSDKVLLASKTWQGAKKACRLLDRDPDTDDETKKKCQEVISGLHHLLESYRSQQGKILGIIQDKCMP